MPDSRAVPGQPTAPSAGGAEVMFRISHYALLSGLCQFIPLPFADDLADRQVRKRMVGVLLARRGRRIDPGDVKPLWAGVSGGLLSTVGGVAKSLVLKPVRKALRTVLIFLTFRRALLEATEALLLGHTLDRLLADGWFKNDGPPDALRKQATVVASAVDSAWKNADRRGLMTLVRRSARSLKGWRSDEPESPSVAQAADAERLEASLSADQRRRLDRAAADLEAQLEGEEGRSLLARFDAAVDEAIRQTS